MRSIHGDLVATVKCRMEAANKYTERGKEKETKFVSREGAKKKKNDQWRSGELNAILCISDLHVKNSGRARTCWYRMVHAIYARIGWEVEKRGHGVKFC